MIVKPAAPAYLPSVLLAVFSIVPMWTVVALGSIHPPTVCNPYCDYSALIALHGIIMTLLVVSMSLWVASVTLALIVWSPVLRHPPEKQGRSGPS